MFTAFSKTEDELDKVVLANKDGSTFVEILPQFGAMLHAFSITNSGERINVIDSYKNGKDIRENQTAGGFKSSKLSPFVCRLADGKYNFNGQSYHTEKFSLNGHAIHGLLYDADFSVIEMKVGEESACAVLQNIYKGTDPGFPFWYTCKVEYKLMENNKLQVATTVTNNGDQTIPIMDGWHPYFTFGGSIDNLLLSFNSTDMLEFTDTLIPSGKLESYTTFNTPQSIGDTILDNCFVCTDKPLLELTDATRHLKICIRADASYPYLQIYTPPHRKSIAIENLSGAPDAFNNGMGLVELKAGKQKTFTTQYVVEKI